MLGGAKGGRAISFPSWEKKWQKKSTFKGLPPLEKPRRQPFGVSFPDRRWGKTHCLCVVTASASCGGRFRRVPRSVVRLAGRFLWSAGRWGHGPGNPLLPRWGNSPCRPLHTRIRPFCRGGPVWPPVRPPCHSAVHLPSVILRCEAPKNLYVRILRSAQDDKQGGSG